MNDTQTVSDYGKSDIATNISAEAVNREAEKLAAQTPDTEALLNWRAAMNIYACGNYTPVTEKLKSYTI